MAKAAKTKWTIRGKHAKIAGGKVQVTEKEIDFKEKDNSVEPVTATNVFGSPINGALAVHMIANFWTELGDKVPGFGKFLKENTFNSEMKLSEDKMRLLYSWIHELLNASFAITFDRNILLKILSQPDCERVRFYLCLRREGYPEEEQVMSLVTVGVSGDNRDLLYRYPPYEETPDSNTLSDLNKVPTESCCAEYGHPPGHFKKMLLHRSDDDPYVLFRYSQDFTTFKP